MSDTRKGNKVLLLHWSQEKQYLNNKTCYYLRKGNSFSEDICNWQPSSPIPYIQMTQQNSILLITPAYAMSTTEWFNSSITCVGFGKTHQWFNSNLSPASSSFTTLTTITQFVYAGMAMWHADLQMCHNWSGHPYQQLAIPSSCRRNHDCAVW